MLDKMGRSTVQPTVKWVYHITLPINILLVILTRLTIETYLICFFYLSVSQKTFWDAYSTENVHLVQ